MTFDLVDQPWIQGQLLDGSIEDFSLRDVFVRSGEIRALTGELPTVVFALQRLLLAILHRSVEGPSDTDQWQRLWEADSLPAAAVDAYLDRWRHRFDLLSPTTPFFQVAGLVTGKGEASGLEVLIADVPNNIRLFPNRHGAALREITCAEAARWVVHAQAFEPSGIRGAAPGDPRAKGGKVYPIGTGWAGAIGGVFVEGHTLRETLLLNLGSVEPNDLPVWERPPQTAYEEVSGGRPPTGRVDAYTWQKARIRLAARDGVVVGVVMANGDRAVLANRWQAEPMTAWRHSANLTKQTGRSTYLPMQHDPSRLFWRGLSAMLPRREQPGRYLPPGVATWISVLIDDGALSADAVVRLHATGLQYGPQSAVVSDLVDDVLTFRAAALSAQHPDFRHEIDVAVDKAGKACWALGVFAGNLVAAEIGESAGDSGSTRIAAAKSAAESAAVAALDAPFRRWLADLTLDGLDVARAEWITTVRATVDRLAEQLAQQAPRHTYLPRPPSHPMCVPLADIHRRGYLAKEDIVRREETHA